MNERALQKLEWPLLVDILASYAQAEETRKRCLELKPDLGRAEIEERWSLVEPLKRVAQQGYRAPVGALGNLGPIFKAASLGQILAGQDLRAVSDLLEATKKVHTFSNDLAERCSTLKRVKARIYPMPALYAAIVKAVGADGELNDDASEELQRIRRQKLAVRKRIEEQLRKLLHDSEMEPYLQDDFFTVRSERYVVPIRLDGRGRVKGSILDTSDSGQTLFIEPAAIAPINDQLLELDLEEKLEILRIFRQLSSDVERESETLKNNYEELIQIDVLTAEAQLAAELDAGRVTIAPEPTIDLISARHPLIHRSSGKGAVPNSVSLGEDQRALIISGPNAGGKTVVLKTVGLLHVMAKAGLLLPVDPKSQVYLFDHLYLEMGDAQNLTANLSTFSGHVLGLKPIIEAAGENDLVLLDELAVGTDPQTGAAIGQAILEDLVTRKSFTLVTTHFDALKGLAVQNKRFRNGSMEFSLDTLRPTYNLILDVPGQSYGIEVAEQMGLPSRIISRSKELRGTHISALDEAVSQLMEARDEVRRLQTNLTKERLEAEAAKERWQQEVELLKETRQKTAKQLAQKYESKMRDLRQEFEDHVKKLKQAYKRAQESGADDERLREEALSERRRAESSLRTMQGVMTELERSYDMAEKLPGKPAKWDQLKEGSPVYVLPLKKSGKVVKPGVSEEDAVEVEVGIIKLRTSAHDLRALSAGEAPVEAKRKKPGRGSSRVDGSGGPGFMRRDQNEHNGTIGLVLQTHTNSIDLRGKDVDDAIEASWNFIDRALLRGEPAVILIHGHGTDKLKTALRAALQNNCPYDVRFRPGEEQEGGDGVTIVELKT